MSKRQLDIAVISDLHLGDDACHSHELLRYLKSISPKTLILNGDIFHRSDGDVIPLKQIHALIVQHIIRMSTRGTKVYYLLGNHDKKWRNHPFDGCDIVVRNHLELVIDHKTYWVFHGDMFDATMILSPLLAKIGRIGYRSLIILNRLTNRLRSLLGKSRFSLAYVVKNRISSAQNFIECFEKLVCRYALINQYDAVICGHIHVPAIKNMHAEKLVYMNSGDWVENLSALEYNDHQWTMHFYDPADYAPVSKRLRVHPRKMSSRRKTSSSTLSKPVSQRISRH